MFFEFKNLSFPMKVRKRLSLTPATMIGTLSRARERESSTVTLSIYIEYSIGDRPESEKIIKIKYYF